jgi:hypothetical protein
MTTPFGRADVWGAEYSMLGHSRRTITVRAALKNLIKGRLARDSDEKTAGPCIGISEPCIGISEPRLPESCARDSQESLPNEHSTARVAITAARMMKLP